MTIDEVGEALGTPSHGLEPTADQLKLGIRSWEKTWSRDDHYLLVTYDVETRRVIDVFVGSESDAVFASFKQTDNILKAANLTGNEPRFDIEFVKALRGGGYTGAIVRQK